MEGVSGSDGEDENEETDCQFGLSLVLGLTVSWMSPI